MAKKEQECDCPPGAPMWMTTYGDMITLVLCFFVLLFAFSSIDEQRLQEVAESMASIFSISLTAPAPLPIAVGTLTGSGIAQLPDMDVGLREAISQEQLDSQRELQRMASEFMTYFAENNVADQIDVQVSEEFITLSFPNAILFDLGRAEIKQEAFPILDVMAGELLSYPENNIRIEGHTDNIPISTAQFPSNWELSAARAIAVAKYFIYERNFSPYRIGTEGFGEYRPEFPNDTPENRANNRRVIIKIMGRFESGRGF
jgi:chemotaxis protein MotB